MVSRSGDPIVFSTYLSHSYRSGDISLNDTFWSVFADQGFSFMIDARSDYLSLLYLETMMRRSHCFVAVVPRRDEPPEYSQYIKFEFDMARLARKPRFVVRSDDTNADAFSTTLYDMQQLFDQSLPGNCIADLRTSVGVFRRQLEARGAQATSRSHRLGLLLGSKRSSPPFFDEIRERLTELGCTHQYEVEELKPESLSYGSLAELDHYDLLVVDASGRHVPPDLFAFAHSRLIPSIKLIPLEEGEFPNDIELPTVSRSLRGGPTDPFLYWRTIDELLISVDRELNELKRLYRTEERQYAKTREDAKKYFWSLGRTRLRVFLSNASEDHDLALALSDALTARYIDHFHYKNPRDLRSGVDWRLQLAREISHACGVFVMLVSRPYWDSDWCVQEFEAARSRHQRGEMVILPFKVGAAAGDERLDRIQTPDLTQKRYARLSREELAEEIANQVAEQLDRHGGLRGDLLGVERIATLHAEAIDVRPEVIIGGTDEWLPARWLADGGLACRAVARLRVLGSRGEHQDPFNEDRQRSWYGTGWLIADDVLITTYQVLAGTAPQPCAPEDLRLRAMSMTAQFGYTGYRGQTRQFQVEELLAYDQDLDYAAVRMRRVAADRRGAVADGRIMKDDPMSAIAWWGKLELHPASSLTRGDRLNMIEHPAVGPMMVALRRKAFERFAPDRMRIEYTTDTSEGSSGSPAFDDEWRVRALHSHAVMVSEPGSTNLKAKATAGIPIEAIVADLTRQRPDLRLRMRRSTGPDDDAE